MPIYSTDLKIQAPAKIKKVIRKALIENKNYAGEYTLLNIICLKLFSFIPPILSNIISTHVVSSTISELYRYK